MLFSLFTYRITQFFSAHFFLFFFFNDTATTEIYTLSLHDALPIDHGLPGHGHRHRQAGTARPGRSEEHTSELQSRGHLVCRLLLEKKKTSHRPHTPCKKQTQRPNQHSKHTRS